MFDMNRCSDVSRRCHRRLYAAVLVLAACTESLPMEAEPEHDFPVAEVASAASIDDAIASLEDALDRVLPQLEDDPRSSALRDALETLTRQLAGAATGSGHATLARVQALIDGHPGAVVPGVSSELDAIGLALSVAERALASEAGP